MGLFDAIRVSSDVAAEWKLECPRCRRAVSAAAEWQTKSLDPAMCAYLLRHGEGGVRLYLLDPPDDRRFWRPWTREEIEESRRDRRFGGLWEKREGEGEFLPEAYEPQHRRQRSLGELPHQWVEIYTSCACSRDAWIARWIKFTDGAATDVRQEAPCGLRDAPG
jgi:hypothetical protein